MRKMGFTTLGNQEKFRYVFNSWKIWWNDLQWKTQWKIVALWTSLGLNKNGLLWIQCRQSLMIHHLPPFSFLHLCLFCVWRNLGEYNHAHCDVYSESSQCILEMQTFLSKSLGHHQIPMSGCIWTPWESYIMNTHDSDTHPDYIERWKSTGVKLSRTSKLDQSISTSMKPKTFGWGWGHSSITLFSSTCCYWTYWTTAKAKAWKICARLCKRWMQIYKYVCVMY